MCVCALVCTRTCGARTLPFVWRILFRLRITYYCAVCICVYIMHVLAAAVHRTRMRAAVTNVIWVGLRRAWKLSKEKISILTWLPGRHQTASAPPKHDILHATYGYAINFDLTREVVWRHVFTCENARICTLCHILILNVFTDYISDNNHT